MQASVHLSSFFIGVAVSYSSSHSQFLPTSSCVIRKTKNFECVITSQIR
ncbi:unnamed protein product [Amoebophrya sp. A120]|nr:unnamed protein product [Amoebophrya sp. A120]|eukprot:GSA120T00012479001.1